MGVSRRLASNFRCTTRPLTNPEIQKAKAADKPFKLSDGRGLYLLIQPTGSKLWRWKRALVCLAPKVDEQTVGAV